MNHAGSIDVLGSSKMGPMGSRSFKNTVHHNLIFFFNGLYTWEKAGYDAEQFFRVSQHTCRIRKARIWLGPLLYLLSKLTLLTDKNKGLEKALPSE